VKAQKLLAKGFAKKLVARSSPKPLISFTFDDFPRSAWTIAGQMLSARGKKATYYGCLGLMGSNSKSGPLFTQDDVRELISAGHELACHTVDHSSAFNVGAKEFAESCKENRQQAALQLEGYSLQNMSFPFGHVNLGAKRMVSPNYDTCRTTEPGINVDPVDLSFLLANPMYSRFEVQDVNRLIEDNAKVNGWLILYTHDVAKEPSAYGCTPEYFAEVLESAVESGAEILTIRDAMVQFRERAVA